MNANDFATGGFGATGYPLIGWDAGGGNVKTYTFDGSGNHHIYNAAGALNIDVTGGININGTPWYTGTVSPVTSITTVDGLITAMS